MTNNLEITPTTFQVGDEVITNIHGDRARILSIFTSQSGKKWASLERDSYIFIRTLDNLRKFNSIKPKYNVGDFVRYVPCDPKIFTCKVVFVGDANGIFYYLIEVVEINTEMKYFAVLPENLISPLDN